MRVHIRMPLELVKNSTTIIKELGNRRSFYASN